jgi:hypothetical protein
VKTEVLLQTTHNPHSQWNTMWTKQNMHYYDTRPQPTKLVQTTTTSKKLCDVIHPNLWDKNRTHPWKNVNYITTTTKKLTFKYITWTAAATTTTTTIKCPSCYSFHMCCNK